MKKTPLYEAHCELKGRMIDFGGWSLPVQYSSIIAEHETVRRAAGLFDVSHMGEIRVQGAGAEAFLQHMMTNDISRMKDHQALYSPMCFPHGGTVDDLLIYKINSMDYLLVVNASNIDTDYEWLVQHCPEDVHVLNVSDRYAQLALQGPMSEVILQKITDMDLAELKFFRFQDQVMVAGTQALVSRTGYTGEDGFEIYMEADRVCNLWQALLGAGSEYGIAPVGLGARDTLRFEAALPLYGHELTSEITPLEANLSRFVKLEKDDFIGLDSLIRQKEQGVPRTLIGFEMLDRGIPRHGYEIQIQGRGIGVVTSGSYAPSLDKNLGIGLVQSGEINKGDEIEIVIRGKALKARRMELPFYTKKYKK